MNSRRLLRLVPLAAVLGILNAACAAEEAPLDWLRPAGPIAEDIGNLWTLVFWTAVAVFFLVEGAIVYALFRFRARKGDTELPRQLHGNTPLEIGWTIVPALILAVLAVPTLAGIWALAREPEDPIEVTVTAHQWWWEYQIEGEDWTTANELHIPVNRPIRLLLESNDVIHSYWVPRLAGKQDVVPGRTNRLTIEASIPGEFHGTCAEYCGLSHANMRLKVFAHSTAGYERWLEEQRGDAADPTQALAAEGQRIFLAQQCVACHMIRGTEASGTIGPDLTHFASRTTFAGSIFENEERFLRRWLIDAPGEKPGARMPAGVAELGLSEDEIDALVAYLQSLD